uniref:Uncharacterized protein n=1 Tax=Roseihalotalea indica TaxID=2867963 RepID=A0AA49GLV6_9BACT|nr:hypothetical protein K4G66_30475 [Tunicatimonas sp. TK19036]
MKFLRFLYLFAIFLTGSFSVIAHPGHGPEHIDPHSVLHYVTSLVHLIPLITVLGIILFAILKRRTASASSKRISRK